LDNLPPDKKRWWGRIWLGDLKVLKIGIMLGITNLIKDDFFDTRQSQISYSLISFQLLKELTKWAEDVDAFVPSELNEL
jgi:hypothetical protein